MATSTRVSGAATSSMAPSGAHARRVTLLETDYLRRVAPAEPEWLDGVVADLRAGRLTWSGEELARLAQRFLSEHR